MSDILDDYEDAMFDRGKIVAYIPLPRLCELATAEREGRVVVLPCKVTDLLYVIYSPKHPANPSDKGKWFMATAQVNRIKLGAKGFSIETWMGSFSESEIGKTVFFTQSEAERALAATEPKGGLDGK